MFQNLWILDVFADGIDLQGRNISIFADTLLLRPDHAIHCNVGDTLVLACPLHFIEIVHYNELNTNY